MIVDIYIDESGDLGFSAKSSPYFVVAALISRESLPIHRCFKKIRRNDLKKGIKELPEFKFTNSNDVIKRRVFKCLTSCDIDVAYTYFSKEQIWPYLNGNPRNLYIDLNASLVSQISGYYNSGEPINVVIDKSLYGEKKTHFNTVVASKIIDHPGSGIADARNVSISHIDSRNDACIQAADFIAGAINHSYHLNENEYYDQIHDKMILEMNYLDEVQNEKK